MLFVNHWANGTLTKFCGPGYHRPVTHCCKNRIGIRLVIINSGSVSPTIGGKIQSHHKIFFAIGSRGFCTGCTIEVHLPRKVSFIWVAFPGFIHICQRPIPQSIKLSFFVHLHTNHHPVRHSLAPYIVAVDVPQMSQISGFIFPGFKINNLHTVAMKKLLKCLFNFCINFFIGMAGFFKKIAVITGFKGPGTIVQILLVS